MRTWAKCVGKDWSASRDSSYACWRDREHAYWSLRRKTGTAPAVNISTIRVIVIVIFTSIIISNNNNLTTLNVRRSTGTQHHHRWKNTRTGRIFQACCATFFVSGHASIVLFMHFTMISCCLKRITPFNVHFPCYILCMQLPPLFKQINLIIH